MKGVKSPAPAPQKTADVRWRGAARRRRCGRALPSIVGALPDDLIVDIVGRLAARSPAPTDDLHSVRATCKAMYKASRERAVGRRVALEREKAMKWLENERYLAVVNHLARAGNPEACFIVGLTLVFANQDVQRGRACLDRAAVAGHKAAAYVLGLLLYTADEARDVGKHYISQVEGERGGGGCETAKRTNRECRRCRRLAADAVREATWKKMAGPQGRVPALPEDGHRCTSTGCGVTEGWGDYFVFCSDGCRIRHEYAKFFAQVLNYLP